MRAVMQRVKSASVSVSGRNTGVIGSGLLVFIGISPEDTQDDVDYMVSKTLHLRAFEDEQGKMQLSLVDVGGAVLVVSQFTLYGDCRKGRRPSFTRAAQPDLAQPLYEQYIEGLKKHGVAVSCGVFQETMDVSLINDGPVTLLLDSKRLF